MESILHGQLTDIYTGVMDIPNVYDEIEHTPKKVLRKIVVRFYDLGT